MKRLALLLAAAGLLCWWRARHDPGRTPLGGQRCRTCGKPGADRDELGEDGTTARARTDVVWIAANFENTILGRYEDELVRDERGWRFLRRVEHPVQYIPGPPPMSDAANDVSGATMRADETPTAPQS